MKSVGRTLGVLVAATALAGGLAGCAKTVTGTAIALSTLPATTDRKSVV